ncbi:hypothetical protein SAMN05421678_103446 [Actinopolymorpha cephalotaxi]|uniref:GAF domain-containing protein n=1 Tax=Actinopolymorpha cephalotaxi TaxID=504797 RepID=A0A1I2NM46_9ACTN|nr:hypothetical protein [Actinopolymorpha cephalotaxi]NYH85446.1 GAF domain-containing protein [Actinopolymorpha cephalotaxi]SFG04912.1 hypothetical protein SAMN05421678_103446 [Actinopolymorpha cephalotaxi]
MPRSIRQIIEQADEFARRFEDFEPDAANIEHAEALAVLRRSALARYQAEAVLAEAVQAARRQGLSWAAIGSALGTSGEAARQRYRASA